MLDTLFVRKRAWDVMGTEFVLIDRRATLTEALQAMRSSLEAKAKTPSFGESCRDALVVVDDEHRPVGVVDALALMRGLSQCTLTAEALTEAQESGFDRIYRQALKRCDDIRVRELMDKRVRVVEPAEPLPVLIADMLGGDARHAVVREGGRIIGLVTIMDIFRDVTHDLQL